MGCQHIEVIVVSFCFRIGRQHIKKATKILFTAELSIPKVGHRRQMNDRIGVCPSGDQVGGSLQLEKIFLRPVPGMTGRVRVPNIRFIPDNPVVNPALIAVDGRSDKAGPGIIRVIVRQL